MKLQPSPITSIVRPTEQLRSRVRRTFGLRAAGADASTAFRDDFSSGCVRTGDGVMIFFVGTGGRMAESDAV